MRDATDKESGEKQTYRPTVALTLQDDFPVSRLELLYTSDTAELLKTVVGDIKRLAPSTEVRPHLRQISNRFDYAEVFREMHQFVANYSFDSAKEEYFVNMAAGTHVELICLFQLIKCRYIPGRLLQLIPPEKKQSDDIAGTHNVIDLDLSQYDQLMSLAIKEQQSGSSFLKDGIQTKNKAFNDLIDEIERVVTSRTTSVLRHQSLGRETERPVKSGGPPPVLLIGATGVGKSQLARRIHELKKHRQLLDGDFIAVNCATLRGSNAMSALFGHIKGAFTGAVEARTGYLRAADMNDSTK